jgi:hypothetical protein
MSTPPSLRRLLAVGLTLVAAAACASGGSRASTNGASANGANGASSSSHRSMSAGARANVLTLDDIQKAHIPNVFDLVSTLRPRWLQTRGVDSFQKPSEIQVYLGSTRMQGGLNALRELSSLGVTKIEWVDGITASSRWGLDHGAGAIVVSTSAP